MDHKAFENMEQLQNKVKKLGIDPKSKAKLNIKEIHTGTLWTVDFTVNELMSLNPKSPNLAIPMPDFDYVYAYDVILDEYNKLLFITSLKETELLDLILKKSVSRIIKKVKLKNQSQE